MDTGKPKLSDNKVTNCSSNSRITDILVQVPIRIRETMAEDIRPVLLIY